MIDREKDTKYINKVRAIKHIFESLFPNKKIPTSIHFGQEHVIEFNISREERDDALDILVDTIIILETCDKEIPKILFGVISEIVEDAKI
jgi:hypothetical protein